MTTLAALVLAVLTTASASPLGRDLSGQPVVLSSDVSTALVFWSVDCTTCGADINALEDRGVNVVAVNTDGPSRRAMVRAYAVRNQIDSPVVSDADGSLRRRYLQGPQDRVLLLDVAGAVLLRHSGTRLAVDHIACEARAVKVAVR